MAEAKVLHVGELRLCERLAAGEGEFVIWDVGLGAAANVLAVLRETRSLARPLRIVSFDHSLAPLAFAFEHRHALGYFNGYETVIQSLTEERSCEFIDGGRSVRWRVCAGDFPALLRGRLSAVDHADWPAPDAILFDPCSPARNAEMWTAPLFADLFQRLDPARPCSLATFSRSTMVRVALLLAGFLVGSGKGVGPKEETTVAANDASLITRPLDRRWLERALKSGSAEPLWEPVYR